MPEDPDRYDLDEMMDRLKHRSGSGASEEGELVTRADGSQAIKVRKRKRRSSQPHKERQRRIRMLQVSAVLVLILLLILAAAFVTIYVNTAPFRQQLVGKLAVTTGAESKLQQFRMNPTGANAHGLDMEWPEGNVLNSLSLRILRAEVSPFSVLSGKFSGDSLSAHTGKLVMGFSDPQKPRRIHAAPDGASPVQFEQCNINNLQIEFEGGQSGPVRLMGSEVTFKPAMDGQRAHLRMTRGDLRASNWPLLRLDRAYIEFDGELVDVIGLSFLHADDERGVFELKGPVTPYDATQSSTLDCRAEAFLLSGLIGNSMAKVIEGRVDTDADMGASNLQLSFDGSTAMRVELNFRASVDEPFHFKNLPALYALSQILGDEWVSKPNFGGRASGRLLREKDRIVLSQLDMRSENRMAIRGSLEQKSGALEGNLEIGIAPAMIQVAENRALEEMFGDPREGFRWVSLKVGGSAAAPEDDFGRLYSAALQRLKAQKVEKPAPEEGGEGRGFEDLTRPR